MVDGIITDGEDGEYIWRLTSFNLQFNELSKS